MNNKIDPKKNKKKPSFVNTDPKMKISPIQKDQGENDSLYDTPLSDDMVIEELKKYFHQ